MLRATTLDDLDAEVRMLLADARAQRDAGTISQDDLSEWLPVLSRAVTERCTQIQAGDLAELAELDRLAEGGW